MIGGSDYRRNKEKSRIVGVVRNLRAKRPVKLLFLVHPINILQKEKKNGSIIPKEVKFWSKFSRCKENNNCKEIKKSEYDKIINLI